MRSTPCRCSWHVLEQPRALHRFADDNPFGEGDAGQPAELRVAALDELPERRVREPRRDRVGFGWRELTAVALERVALALVMRRHVDHERRRDAVVDEVVADPVSPPWIGVRRVAAQAALE